MYYHSYRSDLAGSINAAFSDWYPEAINTTNTDNNAAPAKTNGFSTGILYANIERHYSAEGDMRVFGRLFATK